MSKFTDFEEFMLVPGTDAKYVLNASLIWEIGKRGSGWFFEIRSGTKFDISVPRWLEWLQSPHDRRILLAAAIHDELGKHGHDVAFASGEMRRAMSARGTSHLRAWSIFFVTLCYTAAWRFLNWGGLEKSEK